MTCKVNVSFSPVFCVRFVFATLPHILRRVYELLRPLRLFIDTVPHILCRVYALLRPLHLCNVASYFVQGIRAAASASPFNLYGSSYFVQGVRTLCVAFVGFFGLRKCEEYLFHLQILLQQIGFLPNQLTISSAKIWYRQRP